MITDQLSIVGLFSEELNRELTINQAAKLLGKSYAFTNNHFHEMADAGILRKKAVGSALLCSLDYRNEETRGLLLLISVRRKRQFLAKAEQRRRQLLTEYADGLTQPGVRLAYLSGSTLTVVVDAAEPGAKRDLPPSKGIDVAVMELSAFERAAKRLDLSKTIILRNHEAFWNIMASLA